VNSRSFDSPAHFVEDDVPFGQRLQDGGYLSVSCSGKRICLDELRFHVSRQCGICLASQSAGGGGEGRGGGWGGGGGRGGGPCQANEEQGNIKGAVRYILQASCSISFADMALAHMLKGSSKHGKRQSLPGGCRSAIDDAVIWLRGPGRYVADPRGQPQNPAAHGSRRAVMPSFEVSHWHRRRLFSP